MIKVLLTAGLGLVLLLSLITGLRRRWTGIHTSNTGIHRAGLLVSGAAVALMLVLFALSGDWLHLYRATIPTLFFVLFFSELRK